MDIGKFWMIANVSGTDAGFTGEFLSRERAPRFMHYEKEAAEIELLRLQSKYPHFEFVLLEAVAIAERSHTVQEKDHYFVLPFPKDY